MSVIPMETGIQVLRTVPVPFAETLYDGRGFPGTYSASHWPVSAQRPKGSAVNQFCYTLYQIDYTLCCFGSLGGFALLTFSEQIQ